MGIQFGYVTFFAVAFPLAALVALCNNFIEIRSDAFKLCLNSRKPSGFQMAKGIGFWQDIFTILSMISVLTNGALLVFTSKQLNHIFPTLDNMYKLLIVVTVEHFILLIRFFLNKMIPEFPEWIEILIKRRQYLQGAVEKEKRRHSLTSQSPEQQDLALQLEKNLIKLKASQTKYTKESPKPFFPSLYWNLFIAILTAFL